MVTLIATEGKGSHAGQFSWEKVARETMEVYESAELDFRWLRGAMLL